MFGELMASSPRRQRGRAGTVVSVAVHAGLMGLAVTVATAKPTPPPRQARIDTLIYDPPRPHAVAPTREPRHSSGDAHREVPSIPPMPIELPIDPRLPGPSLPGMSTGPLVVASDFTLDSGETPDGPDESTTAALRPAPDRAPLPARDNPAPEYPSALRAINVTGYVDAQFVVDSTGRVEPSSIELRSAEDPLFADAVRRALLRSRFTPALVQGHPVRAAVRRAYVFRLQR